ncbi:uncharacterized protein LOC107045083 [Diachasma alloeum]|uniref:uncharacterized protein LOC107045083 n=1 Tax=Diachasma alloeum TaxID=454923 RepID=UPI000738181E|nr:uncharacterized protein LOC107045083 [Diachasma alloeum]
MLKFTIIAILLGVSSAAPATEPVAAPHSKPEAVPAAPVAYSAPAPAAAAPAAPVAPIAYSAQAPAAAAPAAPLAYSAPAGGIEPKSADPSLEAKASLHQEAPAHVAHIAPGGVQGDQPILAQAPVEAVGQSAAIAVPVPSAKQLLLAEAPLLKTPASTAKLTPLAAPIIAPISPLAYAAPGPAILAPFPAWNGLTAYPATYSIEQHGYHITY